MALPKEQVIKWLKTLPQGTTVAVDEGGLNLITDAPAKGAEGTAYLELGGMPLDGD